MKGTEHRRSPFVEGGRRPRGASGEMWRWAEATGVSKDQTRGSRRPSRSRPSWKRIYATAFALLATAALADAPPPPGDAHLAFGIACSDAPGEPLHVLVTATPKGPKVTLTRPGADPGPFETLDVNFAHVSRRLFFKARTAEGLIEFQGHARAEALVGLYSDDHGRTRAISLPSSVDPPGPCS